MNAAIILDPTSTACIGGAMAFVKNLLAGAAVTATIRRDSTFNGSNQFTKEIAAGGQEQLGCVLPNGDTYTVLGTVP